MPRNRSTPERSRENSLRSDTLHLFKCSVWNHDCCFFVNGPQKQKTESLWELSGLMVWKDALMHVGLCTPVVCQRSSYQHDFLLFSASARIVIGWVHRGHFFGHLPGIVTKYAASSVMLATSCKGLAFQQMLRDLRCRLVSLWKSCCR